MGGKSQLLTFIVLNSQRILLIVSSNKFDYSYQS
jgi:hypothetical protein